MKASRCVPPLTTPEQTYRRTFVLLAITALIVPGDAAAIACVVPTAASSRLVARFPAGQGPPTILLEQNGLFSVSETGDIAKREGNFDKVKDSFWLGKQLVFTASNGLYRLDEEGRSSLLVSSLSTPEIVQGGRSTRGVWVVVDGQLYRISPDAGLNRVTLPPDVARVSAFGSFATSAGMLIRDLPGTASYWVAESGKVSKLPGSIGRSGSMSSSGDLIRQTDDLGSYIILPNGLRLASTLPVVGRVLDAAVDRFGVLLSSENGVFAVSPAGEIKPFPLGDIGGFEAFIKNGDELLIRGASGLAVRTGMFQLGAVGGPALGKIHAVETFPGALLLASQQGVFRRVPGTTMEQVLSVELPANARLHRAGSDAYVNAGNLLYSISQAGKVIKVEGVEGALKSVSAIPGGVLAHGESGTYVIHEGSATRLPAEAGDVMNAHVLGRDILLESKVGVGLLDGAGTYRIIGNLEGSLSAASRIGKRILIGTKEGNLYRTLENGQLAPVAGVRGTRVSGIFPLKSPLDSAHVLYDAGLFKYIDAPLNDGDLTFTMPPRVRHTRGSDLQVAWRTIADRHPCLGVEGAFRTVAKLYRDGVEVGAASILRPEGANPGQASAIVNGEKLGESGDYLVEVSLQDPAEPRFGRGFRTPVFTLERTWQQAAQDLVAAGALSTAFLGALASAALLWGARRNRWCFEFLTAPNWEALKVWYRPVIFHVRPLRLWLLAAYFDRRRALIMARGNADAQGAYVPVQLLERRNPVSWSNEIHKELVEGRPLWIQGEAGTGKSELVSAFERAFYSTGSWEQAIREYGFMPIVVRARDFPDTPDTPDAPWAAEMARHQFSSVGLQVQDAAFFYRLLRTGDVCLVIDGMNEVDRDAALQRYCNVVGSSVRLLATSQSLPRAWDIRCLMLPVFDRALISSLLVNMLGQEAGERTIAQLNEQLVASVRSGYDVQLIAQCVQSGKRLPRTRLQLYDAAYEEGLQGAAVPEVVDGALANVAWDMFLSGDRRFTESAALPAGLLEPMAAARIVVRRAAAFEFRHDLMRAYVAARRVVYVAEDIRSTLALLDTPKLWEGTAVRPGDRRELVAFICAMARRTDLQLLRDFAEQEIENRSVLFKAARNASLLDRPAGDALGGSV
ncbi:hypothetical protein H8N03_17580 [Ramlibacter sp. USB13]|uniref:NACHT domain-containing protein n=1 Tax=Ramlibacter cellulosilyticus TaxID=2764187 RepID=A0A923SCB2_9BURK|nr:hypothetical protein [Ramlibacter cellulosilyticus]MBC5784765.1 hypothetical protein [Ramlibacter cellulosilyticus]